MCCEPEEISGDYPGGENRGAGPDLPDLKPEFTEYKDEGCKHARSCLECPFPDCLYDTPDFRKHNWKEIRNKEINRLYRSGRRVKDLARLFAVNRKTIHRVIKDTEQE